MTATQKQKQADVNKDAAEKSSQMCATIKKVHVVTIPTKTTTDRMRMNVERYVYTPCLLRHIRVQSTDPQSMCELCGKRQRRKAMAKYRKGPLDFYFCPGERRSVYLDAVCAIGGRLM